MIEGTPTIATSRRLTTTAAGFLWLIVACTFFTAYLFSAEIFTNNGHSLSGWFVPDGITLFNQAREDASLTVSGIIDAYQASPGLAILNAELVNAGRPMPALFNAGALVVLFGSLVRFGNGWPTLIFLITPYYLASFLAPSKDILVAALFVAAISYFARERKPHLLPALTLAAATFFVRDGFGAILFACFVYVAMIEMLDVGRRKALVVLTVGAAFFWVLFERVLEGSFIYTRAMAVAEQGTYFEFDTSSQPSGYFVRLFGNATNLAFRPVFIDVSGNVHVLSIFYWISGLTLLYALICCWRGTVSRNLQDSRIGLIGLSILIMVSITPYVQPRYLLPLCLLIPMFSFTSIRGTLRALAAVLLLSSAAAVGYAMLNNYPPPAESSSFSLLAS